MDRKRITERCSLRDAFNGNADVSNAYKWRHSYVIVIKLTANTQNEIPYKTYVFKFSHFKNKQNYAVL